MEKAGRLCKCFSQGTCMMCMRLNRVEAHQNDHVDHTGTKGAVDTSENLEDISDKDLGFTVEVSIVDKDRHKHKIFYEDLVADDDNDEEDPTLSEYVDIDENGNPICAERNYDDEEEDD